MSFKIVRSENIPANLISKIGFPLESYGEFFRDFKTMLTEKVKHGVSKPSSLLSDSSLGELTLVGFQSDTHQSIENGRCNANVEAYLKNSFLLPKRFLNVCRPKLIDSQWTTHCLDSMVDAIVETKYNYEWGCNGPTYFFTEGNTKVSTFIERYINEKTYEFKHLIDLNFHYDSAYNSKETRKKKISDNKLYYMSIKSNIVSSDDGTKLCNMYITLRINEFRPKYAGSEEEWCYENKFDFTYSRKLPSNTITVKDIETPLTHADYRWLGKSDHLPDLSSSPKLYDKESVSVVTSFLIAVLLGY